LISTGPAIKFQVAPDLHVQQEHIGPLGLLGPPALQADGLLFPSPIGKSNNDFVFNALKVMCT
jgi:hypothetical protein